MAVVEQVRRRWWPSENVIAAELDGEAVLLDVEAGTYFGLDELGTRIWHLLADGLAEDEIAARLLEEYDVEPAALYADLLAFIGLLVEKELAHVADA